MAGHPQTSPTGRSSWKPCWVPWKGCSSPQGSSHEPCALKLMDDNGWEEVRHLLTRLNKGSLGTRARSSGHLVELRGTGAQDPGLQFRQEWRRKAGAGAKSCGLGWGSRPQWQRTRETLGERLPCLGSARGGSAAWTRPEWVKASGSQPGSTLGHWDLQTGVRIPVWPLLTLKSLLSLIFIICKREIIVLLKGGSNEELD